MASVQHRRPVRTLGLHRRAPDHDSLSHDELVAYKVLLARRAPSPELPIALRDAKYRGPVVSQLHALELIYLLLGGGTP